MKNNKKLIIISIILVIAIISAIFAYLFMATDVFKSNKELFFKYISQNLESFEKITDLKLFEVSENIKNENKYEITTDIKMVHSEGGEISNPLNNLAGKINIQKDNDEQFVYADAQILFDGDEYFKTELVKQQELYGIRFTNVAKQFVSIRDDQNLGIVADNVGINIEQLKNIINILNGTINISEEIVTNEEIDALKQKYYNFVTNTISQGTFNSLKNAMITYNNKTIETNVYSVELSNTQVENLIVEILNNLKTETIILDKIVNFIDGEGFANGIDELVKIISEESEIPSIKITVYELNGQTIRTTIGIGTNEIVIENIEQNMQMKTLIQISVLNEEEVIGYNIEISKNEYNNQEDFNIIIKNMNTEKDKLISFTNQIKMENNNTILISSISHKDGIITKEGRIENIIKFVDEINKVQNLNENNNVVLNDLEERTQINIINTLKKAVPEKFATRINLLIEELQIKENTESVKTENEISQIDINKFNAKFEFYTGDSVSSENVKTLLEIVKNNITSHEIIPVTNEEESNNTNQKEKYDIKIYIEKDKQNQEMINEVLEKIKDNKKYKVSIKYKEENGLIDYISINEIEN